MVRVPAGFCQKIRIVDNLGCFLVRNMNLYRLLSPRTTSSNKLINWGKLAGNRIDANPALFASDTTPSKNIPSGSARNATEIYRSQAAISTDGTKTQLGVGRRLCLGNSCKTANLPNSLVYTYSHHRSHMSKCENTLCK